APLGPLGRFGFCLQPGLLAKALNLHPLGTLDAGQGAADGGAKSSLCLEFGAHLKVRLPFVGPSGGDIRQAAEIVRRWVIEPAIDRTREQLIGSGVIVTVIGVNAAAIKLGQDPVLSPR